MREAKLTESDIRIGSKLRRRPRGPVQDSEAEEPDFHLLVLLDGNDVVGYEIMYVTKEGSHTRT